MPHRPRSSGAHGSRPAPDAEWLLLLVLMVHVPVLALVGLAADRPRSVAASLAPIALLAAVGATARGRLWGLPATTLGLVAVHRLVTVAACPPSKRVD